MSDTSGRTWRTPLAFYDPDGCCWRTSQGMFLSDLTPSSLTLPRWGMTRRGELYELPTPALVMDAPESSSLLPTPLSADGGGPRGSSAGWGLRNVSRQLLPTPVAHSRGLPSPGTDFQSLPNVVTGLLPTPTSRDGKGPNQRGDASCLHGALLPTPKVQSNRVGRGALTRRHWSAPALEQAVELAQGQLPRELTDWSELPGWSGDRMSPPSADGSASSDVLPLDLLSLDEPESA